MKYLIGSTKPLPSLEVRKMTLLSKEWRKNLTVGDEAVLVVCADNNDLLYGEWYFFNTTPKHSLVTIKEIGNCNIMCKINNGCASSKVVLLNNEIVKMCGGFDSIHLLQPLEFFTTQDKIYWFRFGDKYDKD